MTTTTQTMTQAWLDVLAERQRQTVAEGWSQSHDDEHPAGDLAAAGSAYALFASDKLNPKSLGDCNYDQVAPFMWPFHIKWWKPTNPRRALIKAAALILAEIERLDRAAALRPEGCSKALLGWKCTRTAGHDGPCAAVQLHGGE